MELRRQDSQDFSGIVLQIEDGDLNDEHMFAVERLQYGAFDINMAASAVVGGGCSNCNCNSNSNGSSEDLLA